MCIHYGSCDDWKALTERLFFFFFGSSKSSEVSFSEALSTGFFPPTATADELGASVMLPAISYKAHMIHS